MTPTRTELDLALGVARETALAAGAILKKGSGRVTGVRHKGFRDLVTALDLASQEEIVARLAKAFPEHRIMAEEGDVHDHSPDGPVWVVDPLDGTTNYVHGIPCYSVSICLAWDNRPVVGVIYDPERDELFSAALGRGADLNNQPIRVSRVEELSQALVVTGFPYEFEDQLPTILARFGRMMELTQGVRRLGSAALDLAYVACGRFEAFWEEGLHAWDLAAGAIIVQEAGGRSTMLDDQKLDIMTGSILASNNLIHEAMVRELKV